MDIRESRIVSVEDPDGAEAARDLLPVEPIPETGPIGEFCALRDDAVLVGSQEVTCRVVDVGVLPILSGRLAVMDVGSSEVTVIYEVPPGSYPARVTLADVGRGDDDEEELVPAYLSVVLRDTEPTSVRQAYSRLGRPLGAWVDLGAMIVVDERAFSASRHDSPDPHWYDAVYLGGGWLNQVTASDPDPAGVAAVALPERTDGTVAIACQAHGGDGWVPLLVTLDASGDVVAVHLDFGVVGEVGAWTLTDNLIMAESPAQWLRMVREAPPDPGIGQVEAWLRVCREFADREVLDASAEEWIARFGTHGDRFTVSLTRRMHVFAKGYVADLCWEVAWRRTPQTDGLGGAELGSNATGDFWQAVRTLAGFAWAQNTVVPPADGTLRLQRTQVATGFEIPMAELFALHEGKAPGSHGREVTLSVRDLGMLRMRSDQLSVSDPFANLADPLIVRVPSGQHPVVVTVADVSPEQDGSHLREAYLSLILSDTEPVRAEWVSETDPDGERYIAGVGVDSATVAFVDAVAAERWLVNDGSCSGPLDAQADAWCAEMEADDPWPRGTANVAIPGADRDDNLVLCHSGWGDGSYGLIRTYDVDHNLVGLHLSFDVVGPVDEPEADDAAADAPRTRPDPLWPDPDLDGFLALREGNHPLHGHEVELVVRHLADIDVSSGSVSFADPAADADAVVTVAGDPGTYPVLATVRRDDTGEQVAYLSIFVEPGEPAYVRHLRTPYGTPMCVSTPTGRLLIGDSEDMAGERAHALIVAATPGETFPVAAVYAADHRCLGVHVDLGVASGNDWEPPDLTITRSLPAFAQMLQHADRQPVADTTLVDLWLGVWDEFYARPVSDAQPQKDDGDLLLAQYGTEERAGADVFYVEMVRQFIRATPDPASQDLDDEPVQFRTSFGWPATAETTKLGSGNLWSSEAEDFWGQVEQLPAFAWALRQTQDPTAVTIELEDV